MRWSPAARRGRVAPATASRASAAAKRSFQLVQVLKAQEAEEEALAEAHRRHGSWLRFKSKTLEWNQEQGYWWLDFKGLQLPANLKLGLKFLRGRWCESCGTSG
ncbi:unnamed protein product [Sphagnum tenellum]